MFRLLPMMNATTTTQTSTIHPLNAPASRTLAGEVLRRMARQEVEATAKNMDPIMAYQILFLNGSKPFGPLMKYKVARTMAEDTSGIAPSASNQNLVLKGDDSGASSGAGDGSGVIGGVCIARV
jgi:hypothetical protein